MLHHDGPAGGHRPEDQVHVGRARRCDPLDRLLLLEDPETLQVARQLAVVPFARRERRVRGRRESAPARWPVAITDAQVRPTGHPGSRRPWRGRCRCRRGPTSAAAG
ncbi:MAG: hypothetical protein ACRDYZ_13920, partial [Acidimicrobiales bacterium]